MVLFIHPGTRKRVSHTVCHCPDCIGRRQHVAVLRVVDHRWKQSIGVWFARPCFGGETGEVGSKGSLTSTQEVAA